MSALNISVPRKKRTGRASSIFHGFCPSIDSAPHQLNEAIFAQDHFSQTLHCLLACGSAIWCVFAATVFNATSRVASVRQSFRMVRGDPRSSTTVSSVASPLTKLVWVQQRRWEWTTVPRLDPDEWCAGARTKVQRLEAALAAFGVEDSPEKDVLKDFLARAV